MKLQGQKLSDYHYDLPPELIAQNPEQKRDNSRMLHFDKNTSQISHKHFYDLVDILGKNDVLILNETRVIPARLFLNQFDKFFARVVEVNIACTAGSDFGDFSREVFPKF